MPWIITSPPNGSVIEDANGTLWTQLGGDGPGLLFPTATLTLVGNALWEITSNSPQTQQNRPVQLLGYGDGVPQQGYVLWEGVESDIPSVLNLFGLPFDSLRLRYILPNGCEYLSDVLTTIPEDPNGCGTIQFEVGEPVVENGLFTVAVTLSNQQGYPLGACLLSLNDGDPAEGPVLVVGENIIGPFALGNTLQITITNIANSECNIPLDPIVTECPVLVTNFEAITNCNEGGDPPVALWGTAGTIEPNPDFPPGSVTYTTPLATDPVACEFVDGQWQCGPLEVEADPGPMTITIESAINKDCEVVLGPFEPSGCGPCDIAQQTEGCQYFTFRTEGPWLEEEALYIFDSNPVDGTHLSVVNPSGTLHVLPIDSPLFYLDGPEVETGSWCVFRSDEDGTPIAGQFGTLALYATDPFASGGPVENYIFDLDISNAAPAVELDIRGVGDDQLFDLTHITTADTIRIQWSKIQQAPILGTSASLVALDLSFCELTTAPSLIGFPNLEIVRINNNKLPSTEVNRVLVEVSSTAIPNVGQVVLEDQTPPAPPSGAGITAKAELEGRSPGWTVTVDP
jgi:hypothetical protein